MSEPTTPQTDAAVANARERTARIAVSADFARQLERELAQAKARNESWETLEMEWDVQAIGKELNMPLGSSIRRELMPAIQRLKDELAQTRAAGENLAAALRWYASATYPDDGSGRPPDAYQRRAKDALIQWEQTQKDEISPLQ